MPDDPRPELQRDVQRLIGRCLLRLQQYEQLMKGILAHHQLRGAIDEWEANRTAMVAKYADKPLGVLVKLLFESFVVVEGTDRSVLDASKAPADRISMSLGFQVEMPEEHRAAQQAAVEELVRLRNDLVHKLIERYDVWTDEGCAAAVEHLEGCYNRIDHHFHELRQWAEALDAAKSVAASFAQSQSLQDLLFDGIAPDGTVDWQNAGIVRALREAILAKTADGWLLLDDARAWMAEHQPQQLPKRYGCETWPQVLHKSRCFRLEYRQGEGGKVAWFRAAP